jgi:hypothetical protein
MTPVAVISVEKVITALVAPESATLVLSGIATRSRMTDIAPVFPARSVATILTVLSPPVRSYTGLDQVPVPRVAVSQFTTTLATQPVSVTLPVRVGTPVTISLLLCDVTVTTGATLSTGTILPTVYESVFDGVDGLPAVSENTPVHTDIVIVPVDTDGVTVTVHQVALLTTNRLAIPPVTVRSESMRSAVASEVAISTEIAPVSVPVAVEERITPGGVTSSIPVSVIPEATT